MTTPIRAHSAVRTVVGIAITLEPTIDSVGDLRIHLTGELDAWSAPTLTHALAGLQPSVRAPGQRPGQIVLDLHELSFLDTGGLTALEECRSALLASGWTVTAGPAQPQVCRLLRYAARADWLADGPLVAEDSSEAHLHVTPTSAEQRRRPQSLASVRGC